MKSLSLFITFGSNQPTAMKPFYFLSLFILFSTAAAAQDDLDQFLTRMKKSAATGGKETAFLTPGSDFMYGLEYFEKGTYDMAAMNFARAQKAESANPYYNYLLALALLKQADKAKATEAMPYLQKAFELNPNLKQRFAADMPQANIAGTAKTVTQPIATTNNNPTTNNAPVNNATAKGLKAYIEELQYSRATSGPKTAMFTAGQEVMYGYDYYQKEEYASAETRFWFAVKADPADIYANYLLGVSLEAQGKDGKAYLEKAFAGDAQLKAQYNQEIAAAKAAYKKKEDAKKPVVKAAAPEKVGGKLTYGAYVCKQTIWNGPNANPQYGYQTHGTIHLFANGTYRWLSNGKTGRYSYDAKTGSIKWLSGYMAGYDVKSSIFKPNVKVPQITVSFTDTYRWECGCSQ